MNTVAGDPDCPAQPVPKQTGIGHLGTMNRITWRQKGASSQSGFPNVPTWDKR